jgi:hypothetical protein
VHRLAPNQAATAALVSWSRPAAQQVVTSPELVSFAVVVGLNLLMLLHGRPDFVSVLVPIREVQPDLRHVA